MSRGGLPHPHDSDIAVTACFLSIPLVALLYAVLSFSVALGAFCIQSSGRDVHGEVLLSIVLGILGVAGMGTFLFFWHAWRGPRTEEVSEEDSEEVIDYGWSTKLQKLRQRSKAVLRRIRTLRPLWPESKQSKPSA